MVATRTWRPSHSVDGPFRARLDDISDLNQVFSDAFTERYRRDGMVGVRVPYLNPAVWRYAIEDADAGAMLWRDDRGHIAAFNMVHRSGTEGWMGPLAVRTEYQGTGLGKEIVSRGIEWLQQNGAKVIGLETMPRTMDNIGFYSRLGFLPGRLTLTTTLDAALSDRPALLLARRSAQEKESTIAECKALLERLAPGYDYTREIQLTDELSLGDTVILRGVNGALEGFALAHTVPLVEGRAREELRVLKLVLLHDEQFPEMARSLCDFARRSGTRRVALRVQGDYQATYQRLIGMGARVRWTDLRMALSNHLEQHPTNALVLSNWEI
jgi:GNAT superfamily N-acetyltransferase